MKKLFSLLTALLCAAVLSTSAFAADDAYSVYLNYLTKSKFISSMELTTVQKVSLVSGETALDLTTQNATIKMIIPADNNLQMEMQMSDSVTNQTIHAYFKDDYMYQKIGEDKFKIKMNMADAAAATAGIDMSLTKDMLKDATIEIVPDGFQLNYTMPPSAFNSDYMTALFQEMKLPEDIKMNFTDMTGSMIIGTDGMPKSMSSLINMSITQGGETINFRISQKSSVKSVNSVAAINYPSDLYTYKLMSF